MTDPSDQPLCGLQEIPPGGVLGVEIEHAGERESLILTRNADTVAAFHNVCPHAGRRLDWAPGRFMLDSGFLICAAHGACFSLPQGHCVSGPCRGQSLRAVAVRVVDDQVWLSTSG